jgi:hypothetical protein
MKYFLLQEVGLQGWSFEKCLEIVLYGSTSRDKYGFFLVDFLVSLHRWLKRLKQILKYDWRDKNEMKYKTHKPVVLQWVDHQLPHAIAFRLKNTI